MVTWRFNYFVNYINCKSSNVGNKGEPAPECIEPCAKGYAMYHLQKRGDNSTR